MERIHEWLTLGAGAASLALALLCFARRGDGPSARDLALPLSALLFVLFGWNVSSYARDVVMARGGAASALNVADAIFTALSPPLVVEVALAFVGGKSRHRAARVVSWTVFGGLAITSFAGFVHEGALRFIDQPAWSGIFLVGWGTTFVFVMGVLALHLRRTDHVPEKERTRIALAALAIGGAFATSDVAHAAGPPTPYLGALGTLVAAALLTTLVVRIGLLERGGASRTVTYAVAMSVAFLVAFGIVLVALEGRIAAQLLAGTLLALLGLAVARELVVSLAETRARVQRMAVLGRYAAQMAHDVRGPLTALLGAIDVLETEPLATASPAATEMLRLAADQGRRIKDVVARYDRMVRLEPQKTLVRVDDVARAVARGHGIGEDGMSLTVPVECDADHALLESAVENVVRNAVEATGDARRVHVAVERDGGWVVVRVVDQGPGMDARVLERACEDFFTTKAAGSGLGLAFVRRVLDAHGGSLVLRSKPGAGTTVSLRLPLRA